MKEPAESQIIAALLGDLLSAPLNAFPKSGERLHCTSDRGVYVIYAPNGDVAHVGNTPRGQDGLKGRLQDHLGGRSSFTRARFAGNGAALRDGYRYRYVAVPDERRRMLLEALAVGTLCPAHLGTGASAGSKGD